MSTGVSRAIPGWLVPTSLSEAFEMWNSHGDDATVIAGGTFIGILMSQKLLAPSARFCARDFKPSKTKYIPPPLEVKHAKVAHALHAGPFHIAITCTHLLSLKSLQQNTEENEPPHVAFLHWRSKVRIPSSSSIALAEVY